MAIGHEMEMLTPAEAAVVAGVTVRNVNRTIDEKILPEGLFQVGADVARQIAADACIFISFYFEAANRLTAEERLRVIEAAKGQLAEEAAGTLVTEWLVRQEFLTVDLGPFVRGVRERLEKLRAAKAMVVEDPEILSGTPVIRGTRVPVYDVAALAASGQPIESLLEDYPRLTVELIELARFYGEARPLRGRPRPFTPLPAGAVIVAHYHVPMEFAALEQLAS
jgi:uncharacterized protein (DUF433 family)